MPNDLMTVDEVAAELRVNPVTVRRRMERGEFGAIYRNGRKCVRIYRKEYEAHVRRMAESTKAKAYTCEACGYSQAAKFVTCPECGEEK